MKRIYSLLAVLLVFTALIFSAIPVQAAPTTQVTFRLVIKDQLHYAYCSTTLFKYASKTSAEPIFDDTYLTQFDIMRNTKWETTITLPHGYYEVVGVLPPDINADISGRTARFEVKGTEMTVYIAVDNSKDRVTLPTPSIVYGKDNHNFHIWTKPTVSSTTSPAPTTTQSTPQASEPLPTVNTNVVTVPPVTIPTYPTESPNTYPTNSSPAISQKPITQEESADVGSIIFWALILGITLVSLYLLYRAKKSRGA